MVLLNTVLFLQSWTLTAWSMWGEENGIGGKKWKWRVGRLLSGIRQYKMHAFVNEYYISFQCSALCTSDDLQVMHFYSSVFYVFWKNYPFLFSELVIILQVILLIVMCLCHIKKEKFRYDDKSCISSTFT